MDAQVARAKALLAKMSDGSVGGTDADQDELGELMDELAAAGVTVEFDLSEPDLASLREQFREGTYVQMAGAMGVVLKSASGDGPWADCVDLKLAKVERGPAIPTSLNLGARDGKERTHLFIRKRVHLTELSMCAASPREVQELWERGAFENRRRKIGLPEDASEIECQLGELRQDPIMGMIPSPLQHAVRAAHGAVCICAVTTEDLYETSQGDGCYKDLVPRGCFVDGWHADRRCAQLKQEDDQERRQAGVGFTRRNLGRTPVRGTASAAAYRSEWVRAGGQQASARYREVFERRIPRFSFASTLRCRLGGGAT